MAVGVKTLLARCVTFVVLLQEFAMSGPTESLAAASSSTELAGTATDLAATAVAAGPEVHFAAAAGICLAGTVAAVVAGKLARDVILLRRGYDPGQQITQQDNVAVAIETAGFVVAIVLALLGAFVTSAHSALGLAGDLAQTAVLVVSMLLLNDRLTTWLLLRGLDADKEVGHKGNAAIALVRTSANIATALVLRGALGHDSVLWERVVWVLIGQVGLYAMSVVHQKVTHYDDLAELRQRNTAAAWPMAGILIGSGLIVEAALRGESGGWLADLQSVGLDLVLSAVLLQVLRAGADALLLPGAKFHEEISRDRNVGAGVLEASAYLSGAVAVAWFLS